MFLKSKDMKTMFRTRSWSNNITEFEVTKLTDKSLYYIDNGKPQYMSLNNN